MKASTSTSPANLTLLEVVLRLTDTVRIYSEIIDKLFYLILQHVSTEDDGVKEVCDMIADVTEFKIDELV